MKEKTVSMARYKCAAKLLLLLVVTACTFSTISCTTEEGDALIEISDEWKTTFSSWVIGSDPCDGWEMVDCSNGRVIYLNLSSSGISGRLPEAIGKLTALETLDIRKNDLSGEFPDELALCQNLSYLDIRDNQWNIEFPEVFLKLPKLEYLYASGGGLKGRLPKEFYKIQTLKYLFLGNNTNLTANLESFSGLSNLVNLTIWGINFDKYELPLTLPLLTKLQYFNCHDCNLIGSLPESYGSMQNLVEFNVRSNLLTGTIPDSYKKLTKMYNFRVDVNHLMGPFPNWMFSTWPNLTYLYLAKNMFYNQPYNISYLETNFNLTSRFKVLRWDCNYLTGPEPCGAAGNNNCTERTVNNTINPTGPADNAKFTFEKNCYSDVTVDVLQTVLYCVGHSLSCDSFQKQVVAQRICPVCPSNQDPLPGATVDNGCRCGGRTYSGSGFPVGGIVGIIVGVTVFFSILVGIILYWKRKEFSFLDIFSNKRDDFDENWEVPEGVHRFTIEELAKITSNFDESHVVGSGGFGKVYSGTLGDGRMVAIKRASASSMQGHAEFRNEVNLLSRLHHRHLVRLEGFCAEKEFQVLVYEFMKKGNLAHHLYGDRRGQPGTVTPLPWFKRLEIAYEVAQGLEYLHSFAAPSVIHRDVKPSNILLDENMVAKLADFGISREFGDSSESNNTHLSTRPAGTAGYLDPEYFLRRQLTTASDVYAFGVVLLELVTGQVAIDHKRHDEYNLVEWVKKRFKTAGVITIVDPTIENDYSKDAFSHMTELALRCTSFSKNDRPTMKEVLAALDPLLPKTVKTSNSKTDRSFTESDWLLAKRELYHKHDLTTSTIDSVPSTGSDVVQTFNVMDMSQEFTPR